MFGVFAVLCAALGLICPILAFDSEGRAPKTGFLSRRDLEEELLLTLQEVGVQDASKLRNIVRSLLPTFKALSIDQAGRLDGTAIRYLVHSYFMKERGWLIRGLEPLRANALLRAVNASDKAAVEQAENEQVLLKDKLPLFFESVIQESVTPSLELSDAVTFIAVLERLIIDEGIHQLQYAYAANNLDEEDLIFEEDLDRVLEAYLLIFAMGNRRPNWDVKQFDSDLKRMRKLSPHWAEREQLVRDIPRNSMFAQRHKENPFTKRRFSFEGVAESAASVTLEFGKTHDVECRNLKNGLAEMDPEGTGRVPIGKFYKKQRISHYLFRESIPFLAQLGVLDETLPDRGPQLIIPNYVAAVSNCDAPSDFFSVCCSNECEGILSQIEDHFQAPNAGVKQILSFVGEMSSSTIDAPRNLSVPLMAALDKVAGVHGGGVPLHGRLFAQWLHYAFPHECAYPHMAGSVNPLTETEYLLQGNGQIMITDEELQMHVKAELKGAADPMSMWTEDEEMRAGSFSGLGFGFGLIGVVQIAAGGLVLLSMGRSMAKAVSRWSGAEGPQKLSGTVRTV